MFCLCLTKMNEFLAGIEGPVAELSSTLPEMRKGLIERMSSGLMPIEFSEKLLRFPHVV